MQALELSIILPVKDAERELPGILQFMETQTEGLEKEIIVVDMGSSDRTVWEAVQFIKGREIHGCVVQNGPGTVPAALNTGLQKAAGEYVSFIFARRLYRDFIRGYLETARRMEADLIYGSANEAEAKLASRRAINILAPKRLSGPELLKNIVTANKELPGEAARDLIISLITLKYTQSNSVCYVKDGQAIGIGAGQQSRVHCTRLAGNKADNWYLRQAPQVLSLPFKEGIKRADRDNAIDVYIGDDPMDVLADGRWERIFETKPALFTREEKRAWLDGMTGVALGSDAFFPFGDNIDRAYKSGVKYVAQPGGSVRDDQVISVCDQYGMVMAFTGIRLFHH